METNARVATREPVPAPAVSEPELGGLLRQLAQDSSALVKQEIALAKAEINQGIRQTANGVVKLAVAGTLAGVGGLVLTAFLVLLLGDLLDNYWVSALIVGVVFSIIGALFALAGMKRFREVHGPEATIATLKEDRDWARAEVQELKRELQG